MLNIHIYPQDAEKSVRNLLLVYSMAISFVLLEIAVIVYVVVRIVKNI